MANTFEELREQSLARAKPAASSLTVGNLLDDENWSTVSTYMKDRTGMTEKDYTREEIRDSFVNSMRGFNSGNSIDVVQEMNYLYRGEGKDKEDRRASASEAYELWDSLGGAFGKGTTVGQKADAVKDYAWSLIADPVNIVSLGFGKSVASLATRGSTQSLKALAKTAGDAAYKKAIGDGVKKEAADQVRNQTMQQVMRRGFSQLGEEAGSSATKRAVVGDIAGSAAFDSAAAVGADAGIQAVDRMVGRQEGYNVTQGAANAALGVVGGALAGGFVMARGFNGMESSGAAILRENEKLEEAIKASADAATAAKRLKADKAKEVGERWLTPFQEIVERGRWTEEGETPTAEVFSRQTNVRFMEGLSRTLKAGDIPIDELDARLGERRGGWYWDVLTDDSFPEDLYNKINDTFLKTVGRTTEGKAPDLKSWLEVNALELRRSAQTMQANRGTWKTFKDLDVPGGGKDGDGLGTVGKVLGEPTPDGYGTKVWDKLSGYQHGFIRMLVTHPATTMLNVVGWAQASMVQSFTDITRGTLYGGYSAVKFLSGDKVSAAKYRQNAGNLLKMQVQKMRNMVDYQSTKDEALEYLTHRPQAQEAMFRYLTGGVEQKDLVQQLNLPVGEKLDQAALSKVFDKLQVAYGVSAQDMLTKTQEFMYALDKQIRLKYDGQTYNQFMQRDDLLELLSDPKKGLKYTEYAKMEGLAVEEALSNVFARKMGDRHGTGLVNFVANTLEEIRNVPVVGALLPFGQFFNNSVAFMADHTGVSLLYKAFTGKGRDPMELAIRAAAGWSIIGWATTREMQNLEDGLAWHEERNNDGKIVTRIYDFPVSFWKMVGRFGAHVLRDGQVPTPLLEEAVATFSLAAVTRSIDDTAAEIWQTTLMMAQGDSEVIIPQAREALSTIVGMYSSGFTRFADPLNTALAFSEGEDYVEPSRNIGNKGLNNGIRYTDQIIDTLVGLENIPFDSSGYQRESYNALNDRDMGANPGRIAGTRETVPTSSIGRLFNDVGKPQWQTELRIGDPEAQEVFDKHIFPILELRADQIMESGRWNELTLSGKDRALKDILQWSKETVRESFAASATGPRAEAELIYSIHNAKSGANSEFRSLLGIFEITEAQLSELTVPQLTIFLETLKDMKSIQKDKTREATGRT